MEILEFCTKPSKWQYKDFNIYAWLYNNLRACFFTTSIWHRSVASRWSLESTSLRRAPLAACRCDLSSWLSTDQRLNFCFFSNFRNLSSKLQRYTMIYLCMYSDFMIIILHGVTLTHWGRVTHICVSKLTIIGHNNGLSPGQHQVIIWTNYRIFLIGSMGTKFSEILIKIYIFSF